MQPVFAQSKLDVRVPAEGGIELGAWLFLPEGDCPHPAITMAHGFAGTKEHGLERFAQAYAAAGFVVLVHDHRNFGRSGGGLRGDIGPWRQIADWRRAISYLERRPEVDPTRIGLWGTSYAGGHALVLGATDRACAASSPRFQRSAVTSKACGGFHLTPRPPWTMPSTRTREPGCAASRRASRRLSVMTPPFPPPTAPRTPSISFSSPFRTASGRTR